MSDHAGSGIGFWIGFIAAGWIIFAIARDKWQKAIRDYNDPESEFNQQKRYAWRREELYRQRDLDGGGQRQGREERWSGDTDAPR